MSRLSHFSFMTIAAALPMQQRSVCFGVRCRCLHSLRPAAWRLISRRSSSAGRAWRSWRTPRRNARGSSRCVVVWRVGVRS